MVGKRIKELRKTQELSLKELSARIDISVSFLSDIENGRSNPSLDRLMDIAKGLNTSISYLIGETEKSPIVLDDEILSNPDFKEILEQFKDFNLWSDADKKEVLAYLKAKSMVRKSN